MTTRPPGLRERSECDHVAAPTVSITTSTFSGSRAPDANASCAPRSTARAPFVSSLEVTHTRKPAWRASMISAVDTPPPAPWIRTVCPGASPERVNSIR